MPPRQRKDLTPLRTNLQTWLHVGGNVADLYNELLKNAKSLTVEERSSCVEALRRALSQDWCPDLEEESGRVLVNGEFTSLKPIESTLKNWANKVETASGAKLSYQRVAFVSLAASNAACRDSRVKADLASGVAAELGVEVPAEGSLTKGKLAGLVASYLIATALGIDQPARLAAHLMSALGNGAQPRLNAAERNYLAAVEESTRLLEADQTIYAYYDLPIDEVCTTFNGECEPDELVAMAEPGRPLLIVAASLFGKSAFLQSAVHRLADKGLRGDFADGPDLKIPFLIKIGPPGAVREFRPAECEPHRSLARLITSPHPASTSGAEGLIDHTLRTVQNLGPSVAVFIDETHNAEDQRALWEACRDLAEQLPEASFVVAVRHIPSSVVAQTPFLKEASRRKLAPLNEKESDKMIRSYCTRFASDGGSPEAIELAVERAHRNPYLRRAAMVPGKLTYYTLSSMTGSQKTPYEMIQEMVERKAEAFCGPNVGARGQAPWAVNKSTLLSALGILALNDILKGEISEELRIESACSGRVSAHDFPAVLKQAVRKAVDSELNVDCPDEEWREFGRSLVGRAGILMEHEGAVRFSSALEEAYIAAQCVAFVRGLKTKNNELALAGICAAVNHGVLQVDNFLAELVSMSLAALASRNNAAEHDALVDELLCRSALRGLTSEEAVRLLFILEVASRFDLGRTLVYPMEYLDEESNELRSTTQSVENATKRLRGFVDKAKGNLLKRHVRRSVQPDEPLTTVERLDYLYITLADKEDDE